MQPNDESYFRPHQTLFREGGEMKYRKKPVVIEAIQWTGDNWEEIGKFVGQAASLAKENGHNILLIDTLESGKNRFQASIGDFIIKGVKGEFYACKPDIFESTYELVTERLKHLEEPAWDNNFQKFDHEVAINQTNKINELVDAVNELRVEGRRWKLL